MPRVTEESLQAFTEELLIGLDTPPEIAASVGDSLVTADLRGHSSHGVRQLVSKYVDGMAEGRIDTSATPEVTDEGESWAQVDGHLAYGQAAARFATDVAVEKATDHGVGVVGLNHVSHIGRVGEFAEQACAAGVAMLVFVCNPASTWVAPPGSAQRRFSTNPIAIGVPTFDALPFPVVADVSTAQVAHGKIKERAVSDDPLPENWAVQDDGESLTDGRAFEEGGEGAMLPLGGRTAGYKGFALAMMSELLASNVTDGDVSGVEDPMWGNHVAFIALDLERFTSRERIASRAGRLAEYVRDSEYSDDIEIAEQAGGDHALLPGESEFRTTERHRREGIPFSDADAEALGALAKRVGVATDAIPDAFRGT